MNCSSSYPPNLNIIMGCGCSVPNESLQRFSDQGRYRNVFDDLASECISLTGIIIGSETESECSSISICEPDESKPLLKCMAEPERIPSRYGAEFNRCRQPSFKFKSISTFYPPIHVEEYPCQPDSCTSSVPRIRVGHMENVNLPMSLIEKSLPAPCSREPLRRHTERMVPIDSLELIPVLKIEKTSEADLSPPRIRQVVCDDLKDEDSDDEKMEGGIDRMKSSSVMVIGQTQSALSMTPSVPSVSESVYAIADTLSILRTNTNENLKEKTTENEIVDEVGSFVQRLLASSTAQLNEESNQFSTTSMLTLLETEKLSYMSCGYNSPRQDLPSNLNGLRRFDLLHKTQLIPQH